MNILLANKYYYNRGGDCIASIAAERLLKEKGHNVAFFSMRHPANLPSPWESYFPSEVDFNNGGLGNKLKAARRIFSSPEVKRKFMRLLDDFKPDVAHLNNIHSQLSPAIGEWTHERGIKVIWTMHDYKLICPSYSCLREGKPCVLCIQQGSFPVLRNKCMKDSLPASLMAYLEAIYWNKERLIRHTDGFVAPSQFMADLLIKAGFPAHKIHVIPNFTNRPIPKEIGEKADYYCYVGRLSREKGVQTLIEAAKGLPHPLRIIGTGPLENKLRTSQPHIKFEGFKEWGELQAIVRKARFLVIPSEWYENNPLSVIEALSLGTPVLGADIGGIPELINLPYKGKLFEPGNKEDLAKQIQAMWQTDYPYDQIKEEAMRTFSAENYYHKISKLYEQ